MGSDENAITIPGGPRVIDVFDGNGAPSGPNCLLFSDADRLPDSLWVRSEVGQSPRARASVLGAPRELWIENFGGSWSRAVERKGPCLYVCTDGSRRACGVAGGVGVRARDGARGPRGPTRGSLQGSGTLHPM